MLLPSGSFRSEEHTHELHTTRTILIVKLLRESLSAAHDSSKNAWPDASQRTQPSAKNLGQCRRAGKLRRGCCEALSAIAEAETNQAAQSECCCRLAHLDRKSTRMNSTPHVRS